MKWLIIALSAMLYSAAGGASTPPDITKAVGLLENITAKFYGSGTTVTGPNLGTTEFPETTVCDPLSNTASVQPENGLVANIYIPPNGTTSNFASVMNYINNGTKLDGNLFFSNINVPTRSFVNGFTSMTGDKLLDANGNVLTQNFALELKSALTLTDTDKEGVYEFALLSDDGARLFANDQGTSWKELVNNDGGHPTRMACSYNSLTLSKTADKPIKLLYFQGAGPFLANVLMWRYVKDQKTLGDIAAHTMCGLSGDNVFYNKMTSAPTAAVKLLESTGWRVIPSANLRMPEGVTNPCVVEPLTISDWNYSHVTVATPNATITWTTNRPATSQVRIENYFTGENILTPVDATLVTNHEVHIDGLFRGVYYTLYAISVDEKGNNVVSDSLLIAP